MDWYLWTKALHIAAVISWMAGLLYLPRLFVYHIQLSGNAEAVSKFELMERRLQRAIMTPAMIVALLTGGLLLFYFRNVDWMSFWIYFKLGSVLGLVMVHFMLSVWRLNLSAGNNQHSEKFFRLMNEVPAVLMIVIVVMVIVRPF
jgi:putative membrane protein